LSGSIATGDAILAAQAMGADFAYIGSAFIATHEARALDAQRQMVVDCNSDDIVYSSLFTGVHGNYLKPSIRNAGLDPDKLADSDPSKMSFAGGRLGLRPGHRRYQGNCRRGRVHRQAQGRIRARARAALRRPQGRSMNR
jgi:nitronate monooxygenase